MTLNALSKIMANKGWWTIPDLRKALKERKLYAMETTISARLRDFRKKGFTVDKRRAGKLYEYRLMK